MVNEEDIDMIDYNEPQEDLLAGESIVNAANKVIEFEKFKREQKKKAPRIQQSIYERR